VTITHETGDTISESDIRVTVAGDTAFDVDESNNETSTLWDGDGDVSAGSSVRVVGYSSADTVDGQTITSDWEEGGTLSPADWNAIAPGDTIRVVYNSPDSDGSSTLGKKEVR